MLIAQWLCYMVPAICLRNPQRIKNDNPYNTLNREEYSIFGGALKQIVGMVPSLGMKCAVQQPQDGMVRDMLHHRRGWRGMKTEKGGGGGRGMCAGSGIEGQGRRERERERERERRGERKQRASGREREGKEQRERATERERETDGAEKADVLLHIEPNALGKEC